jgi:hypothetical protein
MKPSPAMPFLASSGAVVDGPVSRRRSGRNHQVDRAAKGFEQGRKAH